MIDGLYNSYEEKVNKYLNSADKNTKKDYLASVRYAFDFMIECLAVEEPKKAMTDDQFRTPYSPQCLITLFLYNIFYDELDKAVKSNDK